MPRVKSRKPKIQDRPSARTLLIRRLRKSGRPMLLGGAALLVLLAIPLGLRGADALMRPLRHASASALAAAGFRIEHVEIVGAKSTPKAMVERALDAPRGMPILDFSPSAASARIEALGAVRSATVERLLPDTVRVHVVERRPIAIWQQPDRKFVLIGPKGALLSDHDAVAARRHNPNLPLLVGAGAPDHAEGLLALLARFPVIAHQVVAAERIDNLRWDLLLRDHATVKLPDQHAARAMAVLMNAEHRIQLLERPVRTIDLRVADRLVVRPYPKGFMAEVHDGGRKS